MEFKQRNSVNDKLRKYCYHAKEDDFVEVTEWVNGEGIDVSIKDKTISLTYGELEAINFLKMALDYRDK